MEGSESNSYIITLDKMDNNFLSGINLNNNISDGTVPLWSKSNYDDYYEFEIRASRIVKDEVPPTYKCHICNIDVPKSYKKEHNDSTKHTTCLKITDIALKRVQLFMTQNNELNTTDANYNTYFCAPCAIEVPLKDKEIHEAAKQHTMSIKHDNILKDFLIFYINDAKSDEYIKIVNDHTNNEDKTESNLDCYTIEIAAINGSIVKVPFNNFHGYYKVGKQIQCRVCKVLIEDKHKMEHMLSKEHRDIVMVPVKDVHCIRTNDEIWSHCILCNEIIMDVQLHKLSSSHNDKLKETVKLNTEKTQTSLNTDVSKISNDTSDNGTYMTCNVCNINLHMANMKSHLKGMKHKHNLKLNAASKIANGGNEKLQYLIKRNEKLENTCRVCLVAVDNIEEHAVTNNHISKYNDLLESNAMIKFGDRFYCEVCEAYVMECYELYHKSGKKHVKQLKKREKERNSILNSTDPSVSPLNREVAQLILERNNIPILPSIVKQCTSSSDNDLESNKTSNLILPSTSQSSSNVLQSISESNNDTKTNTFIEDLKTITKSNNGTLKTTVESCIDATSESNGTFEVKFKNIFERLFEVFSDLNFNQSKSVSESSYKTTEMDPSETADQNQDTLDLTVSTHVSTNNDNTYFCQICEVYVPNKESNINEHNNGNNHKKKFETKLCGKDDDTNSSKSNRDAQTNKDTTNYYCQPCQVYVTNNDSSILEHRAGIKHKNNENLKETINIKPPKTENINSNNEKGLQNVNNGIATNAKTFKVHYFFKVINNYTLYCKVCKDVIKHTLQDMNEHIKCFAHVVNYSKVLQSNKVRNVDNKFICDYCKVEITNFNEIDHINGKQHTANVTKPININTINATVESQVSEVKVKRVRVRGRKKKNSVSLNVGININ